MKIAFDGQLLMKGDKTGIGWCAENILLNLKHNANNTYMLNVFTVSYNEERISNITKFKENGYKINTCGWFHDVIYRIISNKVYIPYSMFFRSKADVTVFFNYIIPPGVKGKKINFVYDMAYLACPETVRKRTKKLLDLSLYKSCKRADKIITVSEFSKREIMKYLDISADKIVVLPMGANHSLYHPHYTLDDVTYVKTKYGIDDNYFLYLGTLEPRKNISRLIEAYSKLKNLDKSKSMPKLVLAGRKGWMYEDMFRMVTNLGIEESVIFTGYVDALDAPILIKGAKQFIFPSIYEGFGMPPLEAMACGTPVVVSNVTSLPEVVGESAILVDPFSVDSIMDGMKTLYQNEELQKDLSIKGLDRASRFTWTSSANILNEVITELR